MNSKECLERLYLGLEDYDTQAKCYELILKDLDRLKKLEKENEVLREKVNHFKNVKNRYRRNEKFVEKENDKLKKAIEILKDSLELTLYHNKTLNIYSVELMCFEEHLGMEVTQEEYELLKEVLGNE